MPRNGQLKHHFTCLEMPTASICSASARVFFLRFTYLLRPFASKCPASATGENRVMVDRLFIGLDGINKLIDYDCVF